MGLVNQWNVPPGAFSTVNKWAKFGNVNQDSNVLELGCSTGFSLRELTALTSCRGLGIDISEASVKTATLNKNLCTPGARIKYKKIDAYKFQPTEKFSHVVFGAALRFFPNPPKILKLATGWLTDPGYILSCEFYTIQPIPKNLVEKAKKIFDIEITQVGYKEVMKIYHDLELIYEERNSIFEETAEELSFYCQSTISRACKLLNITDKKIYDAMYKRLYEIKNMSNRLRPYQNYNVLVHRFRKKFYQKRFVELF
ncbi:MAG: class I SAM-dependent methyltransferase [Patescibacteria group bacterium]